MSHNNFIFGFWSLFLLVPFALAQTSNKLDPPSDREKDGLLSAVKTGVTETLFHLTAQTIISTETVEYTVQGRLLRRNTRSGQNPEWILTNIYDARGLLLETVSGSADVPVAERFHKVFNYDKDGQLIDARDGSKQDVFARLDDQGRRVDIERFPDISNRKDVAIGSPNWQDSGLGIPAASGGRFETYHNEHGVPFEGRVFDSSGQETAHVIRTFDAQGRPIRDELTSHAVSTGFPDEFTSQFNPEQQKAIASWWSSQISGTVTYKYDKQGRLTERRKSGNMIGDEITTFDYDQHGSKVLERTATARSAAQGTEFGLTEAGQMVPVKQSPAAPPEISEIRYEYVYDSHGNWIEQRVRASYNGKASSSPDQVIKRTLTYF
jgi:hypothetical protein